MSGIRFTATALANTGKNNILRPDADGYYELVIGGLNSYNSVGEYYTLKGAEELFKDSSIFMRRISAGNLRGENGHPKKLPGMSMDDFINRILTIDEANECCHFKEVWLDVNFGKNNPMLNNPELVAIMAKVKPSGPMGQYLKDSLDNSAENVCFSIRALTRDYFQRGQRIRVLNSITTFDKVIESGIATAQKIYSPGLEVLSDFSVKEQVLKDIIAGSNVKCLATEDSRNIAREALRVVELPTIKMPIYKNW